MKPLHFVIQLSHSGNRRRVGVKVLNTRRALQRLIKGAEAATQVHPPGDEVAATILLTRQGLELRYLAHECVHAAYALGRGGVQLWENMLDGEEEERIAYPTGELVAATVAALRERGIELTC